MFDFDFCVICKQKKMVSEKRQLACKYNPRELLLDLQKTLDDFERCSLNCPADFLVFSDIHEDFVNLRTSIDEALSMYEEE